MKTHCIENNWSNVDKNTIFIDEKKFEEKDKTRFTEIFEQSEKALELVKKKLEMMDLGIKHEKKELKIGV
jgi:formiminotetrahydrofolate cyclodeaminase